YSAVGLVMDTEAPDEFIPIPEPEYDFLEASHIIPLSASRSSHFRTMLSRFAGQVISDLL
ncbi:hypothetical protein V1507DRAFT_377519, partial [Lipomyces tetrasporus]